MDNSQRQALFRSIINDLGITQAKATELISDKTKRPLSVRTVRAWLAKEGAASARPLPEWAIKVISSISNK